MRKITIITPVAIISQKKLAKISALRWLLLSNRFLLLENFGFLNIELLLSLLLRLVGLLLLSHLLGRSLLKFCMLRWHWDLICFDYTARGDLGKMTYVFGAWKLHLRSHSRCPHSCPWLALQASKWKVALFFYWGQRGSLSHPKQQLCILVKEYIVRAKERKRDTYQLCDTRFFGWWLSVRGQLTFLLVRCGDGKLLGTGSERLVWKKHLLVLLAQARFLWLRSGCSRSLRICSFCLQRMKSNFGGVSVGRKALGALVAT